MPRKKYVVFGSDDQKVISPSRRTMRKCKTGMSARDLGEHAVVTLQAHVRRRIVTQKTIHKHVRGVETKLIEEKRLKTFLREAEFDHYKKDLLVSRRTLLGIAYFTVSFFLAASLYINFIFGVKFTQKQTESWIGVTAACLVLDLLLFSTTRIMLLWLVPQSVLRVLLIILLVGAITYTIFCGDMAEAMGFDGDIFCELSPI